LTGINPLYPTWSYFFERAYGPKNISAYNYITKDAKGEGITSDL
jgi:hypothetical protein